MQVRSEDRRIITMKGRGRMKRRRMKRRRRRR